MIPISKICVMPELVTNVYVELFLRRIVDRRVKAGGEKEKKLFAKKTDEEKKEDVSSPQPSEGTGNQLTSAKGDEVCADKQVDPGVTFEEVSRIVNKPTNS